MGMTVIGVFAVVLDVYGGGLQCESVEMMPPTPPLSSSNCSSDSEGGSLSPERSAPSSPSSSPYFTRTHLSFHHPSSSSSSHHHHSTNLWTNSSAQQALFTSPVRATCSLPTLSCYHRIFVSRNRNGVKLEKYVIPVPTYYAAVRQVYTALRNSKPST